MIYHRASHVLPILQEHMKDVDRLKLCVGLFDDQYRVAHDAVQERLHIHRACWDMAEWGKIAIVTWGRDCDMSEWRDSVCLVKANWSAVIRWLDDFYANAEGPQGYQLMKPSEAKLLKRSSRDLAAEAWENGHGANAFDVTPEELR